MSPEDTMNSALPDDKPTVAKNGPRRKASEVIAETEERVRAEMQEQLNALQAQLEAANQRAETAENIAADVSLAAESQQDQLKVDSITEVAPDDADAITVNFVSDDMTILGRSWYRGQELTIKPGTPEWDQLWDSKRNKSYLSYTEDEQIIIWGERKFRSGHWSGQTFEDLLNNPELSDEEREELQTILNKRLSRTAAPAAYTTSTSQKRSPVAYN